MKKEKKSASSKLHPTAVPPPDDPLLRYQGADNDLNAAAMAKKRLDATRKIRKDRGSSGETKT
jgi:hypothetical protein